MFNTVSLFAGQAAELCRSDGLLLPGFAAFGNAPGEARYGFKGSASAELVVSGYVVNTSQSVMKIWSVLTSGTRLLMQTLAYPRIACVRNMWGS